MKVKEILQQGEKLLEKQLDGKRKLKMLVCDVLQVDKPMLFLKEEFELTKQQQDKIIMGIKKLQQHFPIEYILGKKEFMKLEFFVNEAVLLPQPDTEILVEEVLMLLQNHSFSSVLDLCTGSGCIAVCLAKYDKNAKLVGLDISQEALEIAKQNAQKHGVQNQIQWVWSDLFQNLEKRRFDIIVSNPPYITSKEMESLPLEVKKEPYLALEGGKDGLDFYRAIIKQADNYLIEGGYLCFEIGFHQKESVLDLLEKSQKYEAIKTKKDLAGKNRVIIARRKKCPFQEK